MLVDGVPRRTIAFDADGAVEVLDQTRLPHEVVTVRWTNLADAAHGIASMQVRGAPLIGVAAAHGVALALADDPSDAGLDAAERTLAATRPTAVNLRWAIARMRTTLDGTPVPERAATAAMLAARMADDDVAICQALGDAGRPLLEAAAERAGRTGGGVRVMTHCNAGWLAAVDWGTALAPVYRAHDAGLPIEVIVSETRPRGQGASLTAWELEAHGVPYVLVADNACGHLLATGEIDVCMVGADRVAANGDVANKVGTYLKALAAGAHEVPFHVVAPVSTVDAACPDGAAIPIEERSAAEVTTATGRGPDGEITTVDVAPTGTQARNPAFDVTPAKLVTSVVTEQGPVPATGAGIGSLFADRASAPRA